MRCLLLLFLATAAFAQSDPGKAAPHVQAGMTKLQAGDLKGALAEFEKAVAAEPEKGIGYFGRGLVRVNEGEHEAALGDLTKALELGFKGAHGVRGQARHALHLYDEALADYDAAVDTNPGDINTLFRRGQLKEALRDWNGAQADYTLLIERSGAEWAPPWISRAGVRYEIGDTKGALEDLEVAVYCDAGNPNIYETRGWMHLLDGRIEQAKAEFERAVEMKPDDPAVLFGRGRFRFDTGDAAGAIADLAKAAEGEGHEYARLYLCLARLKAGEKEKAAAEMREYLGTREKKDDWFSKIARFLAGDLAEEALLAAAKEGNVHLVREQECEAYWYAGARRLLAGDRDKAKEYFEACRARDIRNFIEYQSAMVELRKLR